MPKRRRDGRNDNEVETVTFSMPEDMLDNTPYSITPTFSPPPLQEQVFNVSEWTVEANRVSTSNTLFSSMVEPAPSMSLSESDHGRNHHILDAYPNHYDVVDVSDFQPPPERLQPSRSENTDSSKSSKERVFIFFSL